SLEGRDEEEICPAESYLCSCGCAPCAARGPEGKDHGDAQRRERSVGWNGDPVTEWRRRLDRAQSEESSAGRARYSYSSDGEMRCAGLYFRRAAFQPRAEEAWAQEPRGPPCWRHEQLHRRRQRHGQGNREEPARDAEGRNHVCFRGR